LLKLQEEAVFLQTTSTSATCRLCAYNVTTVLKLQRVNTIVVVFQRGYL